MINELARAFILVFFAEIGDKSQIVAMTFAAQYLIKDVMHGIFLGVALNHGLAILLGNYISEILPNDIISPTAGLMFIIFGYLALRDEKVDNIEDNKSFGPIITVAFAFFIGELGDKTQLTAMTLSAEANYPFIILVGTTFAMMTSSYLGIFIGSKIGSKVSEVFVRVVSSVLFVILGLAKINIVLPKFGLNTFDYIVYISLLVIIEIILIIRFINTRLKMATNSPIKKAALNLYKQTEELKMMIDSICLGTEKCGTCLGTHCLIGYIKYALNRAREKGIYYDDYFLDMKNIVTKDYSREKIIEALGLIVRDYHIYGWISDPKFIVNRVKSCLEFMLFGKMLDDENLYNYINKIKELNTELGNRLERQIKAI